MFCRTLLAAAFAMIVLIGGMPPAAAAETVPPAATSNQVTGPVTGELSDKITLALDPFQTIAGLQGRDPLRLRFCSIKTSYRTVTLNGTSQREARTDCVTPDRKLNLRGRRLAEGVQLTPDIAGVWRWQSDYDLIFTPRQDWPSGVSYQGNITGAIFPSKVLLTTRSITASTAPLTVQIGSMNFFQDPSDISQKGVSARLDFSAPVKLDDVRSKLTATLEELSEAPKLSEKKVIAAAENLPIESKMDETGRTVTVIIPLKTLPDKVRFIRLDLAPGVLPKFGGAALAANNSSRLSERVEIASRFSYAKVKDIALNIVQNDKYVPEQVAIITTNVPVTLAELAKHLHFRQLPKDKPPVTEGASPKKDYAWTSAVEVDEKLYDTLPDLKFTPMPSADDYSTMHSVKLETDAGRWLHIRVTPEMAGKGEFVFANRHEQTLQVPVYNREVRVLSDGALLALGGEKKIAIYGLGVKELRYDVHRITTANIAHFISQSGGDFANPSFNAGFDENNLSEKFSHKETLKGDDPRQPQFTAFDFAPFLAAGAEGKDGLFGKAKPPSGKGLFLLVINALEKDKKGNDVVVASDRRFVLVSDLGLVVKTARDGARDVFVQSLHNGVPVSGVTIEVLGANGLAVIKAVTDKDGHATLPNLAGYENEKRPVAFLVRQDDDLAFMPYGRYDRTLDYSRYETGGVHDSEEGLKVFLFSDRGIYRPGEAMHFGLIVKQGDWGQDLSGLPLHAEISNPRGQIIEKGTVKLNADGYMDYGFSTKDVSPTGLYTLRLLIGAEEDSRHQLGSVTVRVEEFQPDTMKITSDFSKPAPKGWITPEGLQAEVSLMHLYGAPAGEHRIKAGVSLSPGGFAFKDYADYSFFDSAPAKKFFEQSVGEAMTDANGKAKFDLNLEQFGASTYRLTFNAEGFAADSGRSVRTARSVLVSPLSYVVGARPDGNLNFINKDTKRNVHLLALSPVLEPVAVPDLTTQLFEITQISTLVKTERGAYAYQTKAKERMVAKGDMAIPTAGLTLPLDSGKSGSYVLVISNKSGQELQRIYYTIVGESNMLGATRKDAVLSVKLDKEQYEAGDNISLNIVAPYTGAGLITLETDKVLAFRWFKTANSSTVQTIPVPAGFTGKGFVNVQFLRALNSREVYAKPLAYAVQPFIVSTAAVDSAIQLNVPEMVKPGEALNITYQTKTAGKIIIFAVDEGILQYGHYITPKPLDYFVGQRALQVDTAQILDQLMPEYGLLRGAAASGGDGGFADGKNLNPFKRKTQPPVAFWSGLVEADNTPRKVTYSVPNYFNGSLRIMAVAVSGKTMGATETRAFVKGDMIIAPNAPLFAAPDDTFTVGVSVANNLSGSGQHAKLVLTAETSDHLAILDGGKTELMVPEGGEAKAQVKLRAQHVLGDARLRLRVTQGDKSVVAEASLSVRPPVPNMTALVAGYVPNGEKMVKQERALYAEFAAADAALSTMPVSLIPGLATYLERYPYGCAEQILSKTMPAAVLYGDKDMGGDSKVAEASVRHTLSRLRELQRHDGSFGYWGYGGNANDFVSVYALHFMLLAQEKHLPVPDDVLRKSEDYSKLVANKAPNSLAEARLQAYAIYLLTRGGTVTANYLPNLLEYLDKNHKADWPQDLTAVYLASAYRLMHLTPEANALIDKFALGEPAYWNNRPSYWSESEFYNSLNRYAVYLSLTARHFPERLATLDRNILFRVANFIGEGSYNTLSSAYAIIAFSDYATASTAQVAPNLSISEQVTDGSFMPLPLTGDVIKRAKLSLAQAQVKFAGGGDLGLFYQLATEGYDKQQPDRPVEDGLEVSRHFLNADKQNLQETKLGETVEVVITLRALGENERSNVALVDLLPAGFEVVPESVRQQPQEQASQEGEGEGEGNANYQPMADEMESAEGDAATAWLPQMVDAREDRVLAFGTVPTYPVSFRYKIKAVNAGQFIVPPAYAEAMYDRAVKARGVTGSLAVKP